MDHVGVFRLSQFSIKKLQMQRLVKTKPSHHLSWRDNPIGYRPSSADCSKIIYNYVITYNIPQ